MFDFIRKFIKPHINYTKFNVPDSLSHEKTILVDFITVHMAVFALIFLIMPLMILFMITTFLSFIYPLKYSIFLMLFLFPVTLCWFLLFGNSERIDRTILIIKFYYRCYHNTEHKNILKKMMNCINGEHSIIKYKIPDSDFKKHFPIELIKNGLIQFTDGHFGIMFRVDPPRVSSDNINESVESIFNSMIYGDMLKITASSRLDISNRYAEDILKVLNSDNVTPERKKHLLSIYQSIMSETERKIIWRFYAVLIFQADDFQDAQIASETKMSGLKNSFNSAGVEIFQMKNDLEIQLVYMQQYYREKIII